ncbi:hypothetical protein VST7929_01219 [Vibrio stylophorae]|uniref:DUF4303 domain-containing protein n=1 Tax=Vibrio stylophorae TaxID=659351 RepID=A0ABN8DU50_9VIBR|nr:DUF4303 domain-containing protein [Vibrio stylophorae]CAH0533353.1 hypothetical protein VST7929_01219 [Vibrio stylophorae]
MEQPDYKMIEQAFVEAGTAAIDALSQSALNDIYAFCFDIDIEQGQFSIAANDNANYEAHCLAYEAEWGYVASEDRGIKSVRYSADEFAWFACDCDKLAKVRRLLDDLAQQIYDYLDEDDFADEALAEVSHIEAKVLETAISAIHALKKPMKTLNQSNDFIAFVTQNDADNSALKGLMKASLGEKAFRKLFTDE